MLKCAAAPGTWQGPRRAVGRLAPLDRTVMQVMGAPTSPARVAVVFFL